MTLSAFLPLLSALLVFVLGLLILKFAKEHRVKYTFFIFSLLTTIWMFGTFMMFQSKGDVSLVLFWDRVVYIGVVFIPVAWLNVGLVLINDRSKIGKRLIWLGYFLSSVFLFLIPNKYFVDEAYTYSWGAHSKAGILHDLFLVYFAIYIILLPIYVLKYYNKLGPSAEKERIKYALIAFAQYVILGPFGFLPAYGISIFPFAYLSGLFFTIIMTYAIISYRLMDVKVALRQSTVFLGSLLVTVIPIFILKYYIQSFSPSIAYWSEIIVLMIAAILFPVFKERVARFANKYLFTSLYDSKSIISKLTDKLSSTLDVNFIYDKVAETLTQAFHSKSISFWDYDAKKNVYVLINERGLNKWGIRIRASASIYRKYFSKGVAVSLDELRNSKTKHTSFINDFGGLGIDVIVPLNIKDRLVGLIAFGQKESKDIYNSEDFELLKVVAGQVAISLENALLYEETKEFNVKLTKEIERATKDLRQANEELKNLDRAKSEFISIASHQLRTPLTVIKGYGSMMLEGAFGVMPKPIEDNMKKIYESNERLITLVEDLLNISRIESGRLQFNYDVCQFEAVVGSVVEEMSVAAGNKGLKLIWNAPKKTLPPVKIDKNKVRQVVINVIDNAIKYTAKGQVIVSLELKADDLLFSCVDNGMGIRPEDLVNLFQKFSRGEHVSVLHTEGTGLGLYVGKMMIEAHQGKIWAESDGIDKGARFYFTLPIAK